MTCQEMIDFLLAYVDEELALAATLAGGGEAAREAPPAPTASHSLTIGSSRPGSR